MERTDDDTPHAEHDAYWKDAFDGFLPELIGFFAPDLSEEIDWARSYTSRATELLPGTAESETGKLVPDRLYEVHLRTGESTLLFLHLEFQSQVARDFAKRMFFYHVRLLLELREPIESIALLADDDPEFRPETHGIGRFRTRLELRFRMIKLLDYSSSREALIESGNVGAILVAIKLIDLEERDPEVRYSEKVRVARRLARVVRDRRQNAELTRFLIQGIMLPTRLANEFYRELLESSPEPQMPFITIYEAEAERRGEARGKALGEARGKQESLLRFVSARFPSTPRSVIDQIATIRDLAKLDALIDRAATARSFEDFASALDGSA